MLLFRPLGSLVVANLDERSNLTWMCLFGFFSSFLLDSIDKRLKPLERSLSPTAKARFGLRDATRTGFSPPDCMRMLLMQDSGSLFRRTRGSENPLTMFGQPSRFCDCKSPGCLHAVALSNPVQSGQHSCHPKSDFY